MNTRNDIAIWTTACRYESLIPGLGVGVLLDDGSQAALFRLDDGSVHSVCNVDPFFRAAVLSRGIVGDCRGRLAVASPLKKQHFALDDGICLDDPRFSVRVFETRVTPHGYVQIGRVPAQQAAA
ncbi:MAG TPA: nitrite reductase small subunit NirD [Mycobacterium sp.]|nr:nitrite reductase small subunit NirD [Mycobacterium sp.]